MAAVEQSTGWSTAGDERFANDLGILIRCLAKQRRVRSGADGRVRAAGTGHPSSRAAHPDLVPALMAPVECGDSETPLR